MPVLSEVILALLIALAIAALWIILRRVLIEGGDPLARLTLTCVPLVSRAEYARLTALERVLENSFIVPHAHAADFVRGTRGATDHEARAVLQSITVDALVCERGTCMPRALVAYSESPRVALLAERTQLPLIRLTSENESDIHAAVTAALQGIPVR